MNFQDLLYLLPEILLLLLALLVIVLDLAGRRQKSAALAWVTAAGMLGIGIAAALLCQPPAEPQLVLGGMVRADWASFVFRFLFLIAGAVTALLAADKPTRRTGEYLALLILAVFGMSLMAMSANLVMLYLAIEATSLPLYVLAGFRILDQKSVEAGLKYLLFGAMSSAILLYGFSLLWGFSGEMNLYALAEALQSAGNPSIVLIGAFILSMAGLTFKVSAVPFHFWAPDVYEGAPTAVAGFLSTASKAAGFAVLVRLLSAVFPDIQAYWTGLVGLIAAVSMILGNFLALWQRNIKRLLAYSSIAQAGYILTGVAANSELGRTGTVYYLLAYLVTNLAVFGVVWLVGRETESDDLEAYQGLSRRNPLATAVLVAGLLSLGGIPPLAGFVGKLLVFGAAVQSGLQGQPWLIALAFLAVLTSVVGLYYYLNVMKVLYKPASNDKPISSSPAWLTAVLACTLAMIALGVVIAPLMQWGLQSAAAWLP